MKYESNKGFFGGGEEKGKVSKRSSNMSNERFNMKLTDNTDAEKRYIAFQSGSGKYPEMHSDGNLEVKGTNHNGAASAINLYNSEIVLASNAEYIIQIMKYLENYNKLFKVTFEFTRVPNSSIILILQRIDDGWFSMKELYYNDIKHKFCSADSDGDSVNFVCNRDGIGPWEQFIFHFDNNGNFGLKNYLNTSPRYLSLEDSGSLMLVNTFNNFKHLEIKNIEILNNDGEPIYKLILKGTKIVLVKECI